MIRPVAPGPLSLVCAAGHPVIEAHAGLVLVQLPSGAWVLTGKCPTCPTSVLGGSSHPGDEPTTVLAVWARPVGTGTASGLRARGVPAVPRIDEITDPKRRAA